MPWYDDFERALLGSDWADDGPIFEDEGWVRADQFLADGAWQAAENNTEPPDAAMASIRRTTNAGTDQYIEAEVGNFFQGHDPDVPEYLQSVEGEVFLWAQLSPGSNVAVGVSVIIHVNGSTPGGVADMEIITVDAAGARTFYNTGSLTPLTGWQANPDYVIRLDVSASGHVRAYFEGNLLAEDDVPTAGGQYLGIGMQWNHTEYDPPPFSHLGESLRFNWARGSDVAGTWNIGWLGPSRA